MSATEAQSIAAMTVQALDLVVNCIESRFDQPGYRIYKQLEILISYAATGKDYQSILSTILEKYGYDFEVRFNSQLQLFAVNFKALVKRILL
uniref:Uncharacterized protein n=1 Tax=Amphimedon queenslandica TaxID=400682 RepID=A0A1X7U7L9_AMPQE